MTFLDWLIVFVINGAIISYGIYLARGTETSSEWFLGGRALPWWAVGLSMFATNVDNADIVGVTGSTFKEGIHIISVYAVGSVVGAILAAFFVVPTMYRAGFYTNAEYLEARFGPSTRVLSALIQLQYRSSMLGLILWSAHLLLTEMVGMSLVQAWSLIVVLVILAGFYTAYGGLRSVVWTDAAQGIVMMIAALVIFVTIWQAAGGWSGLMAELDRTGRTDMAHIGRYWGDHGHTPPWMVVVAWTIIGSGYWTVNHTQTMRLMGSRSLWDMKIAALFGVALSLPIMIVSASLGIFARALPDFQLLPDSAADTVYPLLANAFLGPGFKGIVVAGVVAAVVSTFDSMGSALSAIFTRDVYARFLVREREDHHYVLVGRFATVGVLALGFLYLPFIANQQNMIQAFTTLISVFATPLLITYLAGVLTPAHRRSGLIGLCVGASYGVIALVDRVFYDIAWLPTWFTSRWTSFGWSILFTGSAIAITTILLGRQSKSELAETKDTGWLLRSREELPTLREHPFVDRVPIWLNPTPWAVLCLAGSLYVVFVTFW
ncbi:MAG: sodium/solute symporter [Planctomycetaceae bacterium]|nr:sodium/solute symporter [Planctomycetales bacterium]MCB9873401.1 sodium/solute symporter [Planctomycetaceae bacterium]MCB9939092.1 sodium/solute symporter [Planctomycetaceae bacterium]HRX77478.1 sodium/solute symporter [Pirellulaceae bacterium]